jgi:hypothetical protein
MGTVVALETVAQVSPKMNRNHARRLKRHFGHDTSPGATFRITPNFNTMPVSNVRTSGKASDADAEDADSASNAKDSGCWGVRVTIGLGSETKRLHSADHMQQQQQQQQHLFQTANVSPTQLLHEPIAPLR